MSNETLNICILIFMIVLLIIVRYRKFHLIGINTGTQWNTVNNNLDKIERLKKEIKEVEDRYEIKIDTYEIKIDSYKEQLGVMEREIESLKKIKGVEDITLEH